MTISPGQNDLSPQASPEPQSSVQTYLPSATTPVSPPSFEGSTGQASDGEEEETATESGGLRPGRILQMLLRKYQILSICILLMVGFNCLKAVQEKPIFKSSFRLLVEPIQQNNSLRRITDEESTNQEFDYSSQIEVLLSPRVLTPVAESLQAELPDISYSHIASKLSIFRLGETKLIEINYNADSALEVDRVLNAIAEAYLRHSLSEQREQSHRGLDFLNEQMPQIQAQSDLLQQELETMRKRYGFMDPEIYAKEIRSQMGKAAEELQGLESGLIALEERYRSLESLAQNAILNQSSTYQAYLGEYQVLERQIAVETARYGENHPTIQLYRQQQENLLPLLQKEAKRAINNQLTAVASDIAVAQAQRDAMREIEAQLSQQLSVIPSVSRRYNELLRQINVVNDSLKRLLETRDTLEIAASQSEVPWQLITEVREPETMLGVSLSKAIMMGFISGSVLGAVLVYSFEKIENTFYTLDDLQEATAIPILGVIPWRKNLAKVGHTLHHVDFWQQKRVLDLTLSLPQRQSLTEGLNLPESDLPTLESGISLINPEDMIGGWGMLWNPEQAYFFLEAFRTLSINLMQRSSNNSLVISSAQPGEGKTTVAVLLAQAAAAMGKRVLLVDAHLKVGEGAVHDFLNMTSAPGMSEYLLELNSLDDCIRPVIWEKNLSVLTVGAISIDPSRFLSSERMELLMTQLSNQFDWVIYDTPSLGGLADARLIAQRSKNVLLVMRTGAWGARAYFEQVEKELSIASIPLTGLVANGIVQNNKIRYQRSN